MSNTQKTYTFEEAMKNSVEYFGGDEMAAKVFLDKYSLKNNEQEILEDTPLKMHRRIAKEFARIEAKKFKTPLTEDEIFTYLDKFKYVVPQGSPMFGIGNNYQIISLSNCYVVETPSDSIGGILKTDQQLAQICKRRGGTGVSLDNLRPSGTPTKNSSRTSTGVPAFAERYSNTIREIGQAGRRGALMETISIHHPDAVKIDEDAWKSPVKIILKGNPEKSERDIETDSRYYNAANPDFCSMKLDRSKVTGANISIKLTDEFLKAVKNGTEYEQRFPVNYKELGVKPLISKMVDARKVWKKIIHCAWQSAEPGLLFWDLITEYNSVDCYGKFGFTTESTNPCSELPLCMYDSCRLLIQNLYSYVNNPFTKTATFDYDLFFKHAKVSQRLMDDLIDLEIEKIAKIIEKIEKDPEHSEIKREELNIWKEIQKKCVEGRRTGLGITAEGDAIAAMNLKYGSDESIQLVDKIHYTQKIASFESSCDMAQELGAFPIWDWDLEKNSAFLLQIKKENESLYNRIKKYGRRNIANLTIAPTGTVSIMTQTSSGIEPVFSIVPYTRRKKINHNDKNVKVDFTDSHGDRWQEFEVLHPRLKDWMTITGETDWKKSPWYGACAPDINWKQRVKLQAAAQKHIDHAISSTLNLPSDVSEEKVSEIYQQAWESGCFMEGNHVYTKDGIKDISEISTSDVVYGHDGKLNKVKEVFDLPIQPRNFIKLSINGHEGITSTSEHPYLVAILDEKENKKSWNEKTKKVIWKKANELNINDHLLIPSKFEEVGEKIKELNLEDYIKSSILIENERIWSARKLPWSLDKIVRSANSHSIPAKITIDKDFCWFIGWFIAEGHFDSDSYLRLTLNPYTETEIAAKCIDYIENTFDIKGYTEIIESNGGKSLRVQFGSKLLVEIFKELCGHYSENKHLPPWFTKLDKPLLSTIIDNHWKGDKGITISTQLARELFMARNILDQQVYMHQNYGEGYEIREKDSYKDSCAKDLNSYKAYRISSIDNFNSSEKVYNFSVENSESYIVNGLIVHNCKGITVYRDKCRSGVLINKEEKKEESVVKTVSPKRPKQLVGELYFFNFRGNKYFVAVGLMNGTPYEIFTGFNSTKKHDFIPKEATVGVIIKNKRSDYVFKDDITGEAYTLNNGHADDNADALTRIISCALRHGSDIAFIVHQLEKTTGDLTSFSKCLARTLKKYISNGQKVHGEECPECKTELQRESGCIICKSCGWTKCS